MYKKGIVAAASFMLVVGAVAYFSGITIAKEARIDPMKLYILKRN